jgi:hypothetical protein
LGRQQNESAATAKNVLADGCCDQDVWYDRGNNAPLHREQQFERGGVWTDNHLWWLPNSERILLEIAA